MAISLEIAVTPDNNYYTGGNLNPDEKSITFRHGSLSELKSREQLEAEGAVFARYTLPDPPRKFRPSDVARTSIGNHWIRSSLVGRTWYPAADPKLWEVVSPVTDDDVRERIQQGSWTYIGNLEDLEDR